MGVSDVLEFTRATHGLVIANHLEAISHCPVTRDQLLIAAQHAGLSNRLVVPQDGETVCVDHTLNGFTSAQTEHSPCSDPV